MIQYFVTVVKGKPFSGGRKITLAKRRETLYNNNPTREYAGVMELVDVTDSKSVGLIPRVGSSPTTGTKPI